RCLPLALSAKPAALSDNDFACYLVRELERADGQRRHRRELLGTIEAAVGERLPYCLFDLALSGDAELLEKLPDACVQHVLIHGPPPSLSAPRVAPNPPLCSRNRSMIP